MVASAPSSLVYHIPESKPYLVLRRSKDRGSPSGFRNCKTFAENEKRPAHGAERDMRE
jgi:hypothetical protein